VERIAAAESGADAKPTEPPPHLSEECLTVAQLAAPPDAKRAFDAALGAAALLGSQLSRLEGATGVEMVARDAAGKPEGITLTGWSALLGIAALVVAVLGGAWYAWRQYTGAGDAATVVLKTRHQPYVRVSTSGS
jgi:Golgi apparatus protein 1